MWQHPPVTYEVNIHKKRKVTVQNVICTQGLSLIIVVLFSRYTDIETLFSFISIIKKDNSMGSSIFWETHWYCMSSIQCGKVLCWPWSMIAYLTIQRFKGQIEKLCFSSTFSRRGNLVNTPIIALWTLLISRDQWWTACNYKASLEKSLFGSLQ